jgi:single-strand DNA-binding protein
MSDVNVTTISGRLVRNANVKTLDSGNTIAELSLASNRKFKDNEETLFIDVDVWGKQAEALAPYMLKGKYLIITGRLKQDTWQGEDGSNRSKIVLVADSVTLPPLQAQSE